MTTQPPDPTAEKSDQATHLPFKVRTFMSLPWHRVREKKEAGSPSRVEEFEIALSNDLPGFGYTKRLKLTLVFDGVMKTVYCPIREEDCEPRAFLQHLADVCRYAQEYISEPEGAP